MPEYEVQSPVSASYRGAPLYYKGRDGRLRVWEVWAEEEVVSRSYGIVGGKMQLAQKKCKSKGKGKAQTTSFEQAIKEATAKHKNKLDRRYVDNPADASLPLQLPMLADSLYTKEPPDITPKGKKLLAKDYDVQPKIDGARGLARWDDDDIILISRSGKLWLGMEHIIEPLKKVLPRDWEADGELYCHGVPLQTIMSWLPKENAKKFKPERLQLEFWIFDVPVVNGDETLTWYERRFHLKPIDGTPQLYDPKVTQIQIVPYKQCTSLEEFFQMEEKIVSKGFEGAILRAHDGVYDFGRRSPSILKAKRFTDKEFQIAGYTDGVGKFEGAVVFRCMLHGHEGEIPNDDNSFEVVPRGSMKSKRDLFQHGECLLGKKLTVRHFGETCDGKPFIPVGIPNGAILRHDFDQP